MIKAGDLENRDFDKHEPKGAEAVHADQARVTGRGRESREAHLAELRECLARLQGLAVPDGVGPEDWARALGAIQRVIDTAAA
jgi:hypothetical protein